MQEAEGCGTASERGAKTRTCAKREGGERVEVTDEKRGVKERSGRWAGVAGLRRPISDDDGGSGARPCFVGKIHRDCFNMAEIAGPTSLAWAR